MKNSATANTINKIAIAVLLTGSLVFHVRQALSGINTNTNFPKPATIKPAKAANLLPSSELSFSFLSSRNFFKP
ncbi:MAG TPA: hypothetical protein VEY10_07315 [Flavisolibacter sp.]|jgi:hypothetical protein|nr:hypothetical protein [Flavisolibacter sp.]